MQGMFEYGSRLPEDLGLERSRDHRDVLGESVTKPWSTLAQQAWVH